MLYFACQHAANVTPYSELPDTTSTPHAYRFNKDERDDTQNAIIHNDLSEKIIHVTAVN